MNKWNHKSMFLSLSHSHSFPLSKNQFLKQCFTIANYICAVSQGGSPVGVAARTSGTNPSIHSPETWRPYDVATPAHYTASTPVRERGHLAPEAAGASCQKKLCPIYPFVTRGLPGIPTSAWPSFPSCPGQAFLSSPSLPLRVLVQNTELAPNHSGPRRPPELSTRWALSKQVH